MLRLGVPVSLPLGGYSMDLLSGLGIAFALLTLAVGILAIRLEREVKKLKKRARYLNERLEAVEKFNGLNATNTDIRAI